jgi:RHS repeat-associated protein
MPGRDFQAGEYRYGFNGQEASTEIGSNRYTAEFWQYDSRLGRRWNRDPVLKIFESPYATLSNNPVNFLDPGGDNASKEKKPVNVIVTLDAKTAAELKDTRGSSWHVITASSVAEIPEVLKKFLESKNATLVNLAFVHHGNDYGYGEDNKPILLGGKDIAALNQFAKTIVERNNNTKPADFDAQLKAEAEGKFTESEVDGYVALGNTLNQISSGGNYFSIACDEADDINTAKELNYLAGGSINAYVNSNGTTIQSTITTTYRGYNPKSLTYGSILNQRLTPRRNFVNSSGWVYYNHATQLTVSTGKDLILNSVGNPFSFVNDNYVDKNRVLRIRYYSNSFHKWVKTNSGDKGYNNWVNTTKENLGIK